MPPLSPVIRNLMLACVAVFCVQLLAKGWLETWFALWPVASGAFMPWQLVTYAFLHAGEVHLFFNLLGLWMFGSELERLWSAQRFLRFLLAGVLSAAATQMLVTWLIGSANPTVGLSGALYALLLGYALVFPKRQYDLVGFLPMALMMIPSSFFNLAGIALFVVMLTNRAALPIPPFPVPALATVAIFGVIELFLGVLGRTGIAHFAHLGGMLGGWLMIRFWRGQLPFGKRR